VTERHTTERGGRLVPAEGGRRGGWTRPLRVGHDRRQSEARRERARPPRRNGVARWTTRSARERVRRQATGTATGRRRDRPPARTVPRPATTGRRRSRPPAAVRTLRRPVLRASRPVAPGGGWC